MAGNKKPLFGRESYGDNRPLGTPKLDPWGNSRENPLDAVLPTTPEVVRKVKNTYENATPVMLPRTMAAPEGARTINAIKLLSVAVGATLPLFNYVCKPGATSVFYAYDLIVDTYQDGLVWTPKMDGARCLQFHGDPTTAAFTLGSPNKIVSLGYSADSYICQILMEPGQRFSWEVTNNSLVPVVMGVRLSGYMDMSQRLTASKFGD